MLTPLIKVESLIGHVSARLRDTLTFGSHDTVDSVLLLYLFPYYALIQSNPLSSALTFPCFVILPIPLFLFNLQTINASLIFSYFNAPVKHKPIKLVSFLFSFSRNQKNKKVYLIKVS